MHESSRADLLSLWRELGLAPGQLVMCHSFLASLGRIEGGPTTVLETLAEAIGPEGTLVVPAFSYSYFRQEVFDADNSPSTVGVLGDLARVWPGAVRSDDPVFSMVAIGPDAEKLMTRNAKQSFGVGSIYDQLCRAGLRILLLGVDFSALSLFMHLEKLNGVSYRYDKRFSGMTRRGGEQWGDEVVHFVRDLELDFESDRTRIGQVIEASPHCRTAFYGYSMHRYVSAQSVAELVRSELQRDPHALVRFSTGAERRAGGTEQ